MRHDRISRAALGDGAGDGARRIGGEGHRLPRNSIVDFLLPTTGVYAITAWGVAGGSVGSGPTVEAGGIGGELGGTFNLVGGHSIAVLVGQQGNGGYYAGGGGTFV